MKMLAMEIVCMRNRLKERPKEKNKIHRKRKVEKNRRANKTGRI